MDLFTSGFTFPNESGVTWSLMIVLYPYITGLVAGAFIVASLFHVGGREELRPVSKFALVAAFSFCAFATTPLLLHLHQPQRAFNIMVTPHFTSAMSGFGFIYSFYLLLLAVEIWLVFRPDIVKGAQEPGVMGLFYKALSLGVLEITPEAQKLDDKAIHFFSVVGIPAACVLHGYVGFIFGAIKANPWWSTSLMPIIFLMSAIVSGLAMLTILYIIISKLRGVPTSFECLKGMMKFLAIFLVVAVALEELAMLNMAYESDHSWNIINTMLHEKMRFSYVYIQNWIGAGGALFVLAILNFVKLKEGSQKGLAFLASSLVLAQVLAMRWNVVIGGQAYSKSFRGYLPLHVEWLGREGILAAILVMTMPFVLLAVLSKVFPIWDVEERHS